MSGDAFQAAADGKITIPDFSDLITHSSYSDLAKSRRLGI
jgi:hypothetical protein